MFVWSSFRLVITELEGYLNCVILIRLLFLQKQIKKYEFQNKNLKFNTATFSKESAKKWLFAQKFSPIDIRRAEKCVYS